MNVSSWWIVCAGLTGADVAYSPTTAEDVVLQKLIWNRILPSDRRLGDAARVVAIQASTLDRNYLKQWAHELKLAKELEGLLGCRIKPKQL